MWCASASHAPQQQQQELFFHDVALCTLCALTRPCTTSALSHMHMLLALVCGASPTQIVQFIIQNTGGPSAQQSLGDMPITGGFCDPFTGGGQREAAPALPHTSRPPPAAAAANTGPISVTGGFCDPFTGGASSSKAQCALPNRRQVPACVCLLFDGPPPAAGLKKKLLEFNSQLGGGGAAGEAVGPDALITEQEAAEGGEWLIECQVGVCWREGSKGVVWWRVCVLDVLLF